MSEVIEAYRELLKLAGRGRAFVDSEVFYPTPTDDDDPRRTQVVGHGYDFEHAVAVIDRSTDCPVQGTAKLRIIHMIKEEKPSLFLRTRLEWTTSDGAEHSSQASYNLDTEAVARLAASEPADESLSELDLDEVPSQEARQRAVKVLFAALDEAEIYKATWSQAFPGSDADLDTLLDSSEAELAEAEAITQYHSAAIVAAVEAEPQLLCMLSDTELGAVRGEGLIELLAWVRTQPELVSAGS